MRRSKEEAPKFQFWAKKPSSFFINRPLLWTSFWKWLLRGGKRRNRKVGLVATREGPFLKILLVAF